MKLNLALAIVLATPPSIFGKLFDGGKHTDYAVPLAVDPNGSIRGKTLRNLQAILEVDECQSNPCPANAFCQDRNTNNFGYKCGCPSVGYEAVNPVSNGVLSKPLLHGDSQFGFKAGDEVPATDDGVPVVFRPIACTPINTGDGDTVAPTMSPVAKPTTTNTCNTKDCSKKCVEDEFGNFKSSGCAEGYSETPGGGCKAVNPCDSDPCAEGATCTFLEGGLNDSGTECDAPGLICVCPTNTVGGAFSGGCFAKTASPTPAPTGSPVVTTPAPVPAPGPTGPGRSPPPPPSPTTSPTSSPTVSPEPSTSPSDSPAPSPSPSLPPSDRLPSSSPSDSPAPSPSPSKEPTVSPEPSTSPSFPFPTPGPSPSPSESPSVMPAP